VVVLANRNRAHSGPIIGWRRPAAPALGTGHKPRIAHGTHVRTVVWRSMAVVVVAFALNMALSVVGEQRRDRRRPGERRPD
jgi:hypothetical protein